MALSSETCAIVQLHLQSKRQQRHSSTPCPRKGGERVARAIQSLTELDPRAVVLSVDGIGAFDLIARAAMLDGLLTVDGGDTVLLFVLQFYSEPSQYLWEDNTGDIEQGDPLMPLLFSLGQHSALQFLLPLGERLIAYLDDLYVVCSPEQVGTIFTKLGTHPRTSGKTKVWNRACLGPAGCSSIQEAAERVDPDASVWTSDVPLSNKVSAFWGPQAAHKSLYDHKWSRPF